MAVIYAYDAFAYCIILHFLYKSIWGWRTSEFSVGKPAQTEAFELLAVPWLSEGELVQPKFIVHAASRGYMCRANMLSEVNDTRRRHKRSKIPIV